MDASETLAEVDDEAESLCSGDLFDPNVYLIRFDTVTGTFSRPLTNALEDEELLLCLDGPRDPLVDYTVETSAESSQEDAPQTLTANVGLAPNAASINRLIEGVKDRPGAVPLHVLGEEDRAAYLELLRIARVLKTLRFELIDGLTGLLSAPRARVDHRAAERALRRFMHALCGRLEGESRDEETELRELDVRRVRGACPQPDGRDFYLPISLLVDQLSDRWRYLDGRWIPTRPVQSERGPTEDGGDAAGAADDATHTVVELTQQQAVSLRGADLRRRLRISNSTRSKRSVSIQVDAVPGFDPVLTLISPGSPVPLVMDDTPGLGYGARIVFEQEGGETHYVRVRDYYGSEIPADAEAVFVQAAEAEATTQEESQEVTTEPDPGAAARLFEDLFSVLDELIASYRELRTLAMTLATRHARERTAYRIGSFSGNSLLTVIVNEYERHLEFPDRGRTLRIDVRRVPARLAVTIADPGWLTFSTGVALSWARVPRFDFRPASDTANVVTREVDRRSFSAALFATVQWCATDPSETIYRRRCAGYGARPALTEEIFGDQAAGPLVSREGRRLRRRERARRFTPSLALGIPLGPDTLDLNLFVGLALPYIPFVQLTAGVHLLRVRKLNDGVVLAPGAGSPGAATPFPGGVDAVDAATSHGVEAGFFIGLMITDELVRRLFPTLEAAQ